MFLFPLFFLILPSTPLNNIEEFDPLRVRIVDTFSTTGYLVRGNQFQRKIDNSNYQLVFQELKDTILSLINTTTTESLENVYIYDYSLLIRERNDDEDGPFLDMEQKYFADNPSEGKFLYRPTFGDISGGNYTNWKTKSPESSVVISKMVSDPTPRRIAEIRSLLMKGTPKTPVVVYVHCAAGRDRTGQIISSYKMRYWGWDRMQVQTDNDEIFGKWEPHPTRMFSISLYCYYLKITGVWPHLDCTYR